MVHTNNCHYYPIACVVDIINDLWRAVAIRIHSGEVSMKMEITQGPHLLADPPAKSDWHAWLKTHDGYHIKVQIDYHASEERAKEIIAQMAGEG